MVDDDVAGLAAYLLSPESGVMTGAVIDVSPRLLPLFIASAALAMTVSYLTPFAPGGIVPGAFGAPHRSSLAARSIASTNAFGVAALV